MQIKREMSKEKRKAIQALLDSDGDGQITAADIAFVAAQEEKKRIDAIERGKGVPRSMPKEDWEKRKDFLLDHAGDADWIPFYGDSLRALKEDRQEDFDRFQDLMWKRIRKSLFSQFEL